MPVVVKGEMDEFLAFVHDAVGIGQVPGKVRQDPPVTPGLHIVVRHPERQRIAIALGMHLGVGMQVAKNRLGLSSDNG